MWVSNSPVNSMNVANAQYCPLFDWAIHPALCRKPLPLDLFQYPVSFVDADADGLLRRGERERLFALVVRHRADFASAIGVMNRHVQRHDVNAIGTARYG